MRASALTLQQQPFISVITVVLNRVQMLKNTIQSVISQEYPFFEFIIVDGASVDGTVDLIRRYEKFIAWWVSEPDDGIGDAMNKGIQHSSGQYLYFLHSDDRLLRSSSLAHVAAVVDWGSEIHAFPVYFSSQGNLYLRKSRGFSPWLNFKTGLYHQGVFFNRQLFERLGPYDKSFRIAMDYEFFLRAYRAGAKLELHDEPVAVMRDTGVSSRRDWPTLQTRFREEMRVHQKHLNNDLLRRLYFLYWPFYMAYRRLRAIRSVKNSA